MKYTFFCHITTVFFCKQFYNYFILLWESSLKLVNRTVKEKIPLNIQGPVVQRIVSLTSSLRAISLTVLVDSIQNILIFFAEKM